MKQGLSLQELVNKLEADKAGKKDMLAPAGQLALSTLGGGVRLEIPEHGHFPIRPLAHRQLAEYTGIPAKYYERMQTEAPDLLASNVTHWLRDKSHLAGQTRMVRMMNGEVRAILSNRYLRVDNYDVAEKALLALREKEIKIVSCNVTESNLYIQAVLPGLKAEVKGSRQVGDLIEAGVSISNSEVGLGTLQVREYDFRLVCLNGMVGEKLMRKTHLGAALEGDGVRWADDTQRAADDLLMLQIRDNIAAAIEPARFQARIEKMSGLTQMEIDGDPNQVVEVLGSVVNLTETEQSGILKTLMKSGDPSAFGLLNALTYQAHTAEYDRAVELEAAGGKLLELPKSEWKRILEPKE